MNETVLDNPAWEALTSVHANFAEGNEYAKRYRAGILPFTGYRNEANGGMLQLDEYINRGDAFYIIGDALPTLPDGWTIQNELPCAQMILRQSVKETPSNNPVAIDELGDPDAGEMLDLITMVQPGYYNIDTRLLGTYYGIRKEGKLVAMAGERMRMAGFSELSAICTMSGYTGRGYAQQLIASLCTMHAKTGVVSFLHVALTNQRAIGLYQHMGFEQRRTIVFRRVRKA